MKIKVLTSCSEISIKMTEDLSLWVKLPARILIYIISIIAIVLFSPFYPLFEYIYRKNQNAVHNLRKSLKVIWNAESSNAALLELRNVYEQVKSYNKRGKKFKTEKYGIFSSCCCMEMAELLYYYEIYLGNWDVAYGVCKEALEFFNYEELLTESPNRKWKKIEQKIITRNGNHFFNHYLEAEFFLFDHKTKKTVLSHFGHPEWSPNAPDSILSIKPHLFFRIGDPATPYFLADYDYGWESSGLAIINLSNGRVEAKTMF